MKEKPNDENYRGGGQPNGAFAAAAVAVTVLGAIFYGLTFTPLGVTSLCVATVCALAALSLLTYQKKRGVVKIYKPALVFAYVLFALCILTLVGGTVYAALFKE